MPLLKHSKPLGSVDYTSAGRHTLSIPRDGILTQLNVRVRFTITNSATSPVTPLFKALSRIIARLEIVLNGRDTVVNMTGPGLEARATYEKGVRPYGTGDTVVLTASAATAYDIIIPVQFYLPRSVNPLVCALPAERLGQVTLAITWANSDCSDIFTTPNSAAISLVTCDVDGEYLLGASADQTFLARVLDHQIDEVTATSTDKQITLDTGTGLLYRSFLVTALDAKVADDTVINEFRLESGTAVFLKRKYPFLQAEDQNRFVQTSPQAGVVYLGTEWGGRPEMWLNTSPEVMRSDLKLIGDVTIGTGTTNLISYKETVRPFKR